MIASPQPLLEVAVPTETEMLRLLEMELEARAQWLTADDLLKLWRFTPNDTLKRSLRHCASQSEWVISGQHGYKHLKFATAEEINHAANWLESQAKKMSERAGAIRRNAHKLFGG